MRRFAKDWVMLLAANGLSQGATFVAIIVFARKLTLSEFGLIATYLAVVAFFFGVGQLGTKNVIIRQIACRTYSSRMIYSSLLMVKLIACVCAGILGSAYLLLSGTTSDLFVIIGGFAAIACLSWAEYLESFLIGKGHIGKYALVNVISAALSLVYIAISSITFFTAIVFTLLGPLIRVVFFSFWDAADHIRLEDNDIKSDLRTLLMKESRPFFWQILITISTSQVPIILLGKLSSIQEVANFSAAYRTSLPLLLMINSMTTILLPRISKLSSSGQAIYSNVVIRFLNSGTFFFTILAVVGAIFAERIMILLFGTEYKVAGPILALQLWHLAFQFVFNTIGTCMTATGKQVTLAKFGTLYTFILLLSCSIGSIWGGQGLAWGYIVSAFINMTYHWIYFRNRLVPIANNSLMAWFVALFLVSVVLFPHLSLLISIPLVALIVGIGFYIREFDLLENVKLMFSALVSK